MDPLPAELTAAVRRRLRERGVHGLTLCAFDTRAIRFAGGVGFADLERAEAAAPTTVLRVASISKLLTATLVLRLAEARRVDLDEPVNDRLPDRLRIADPDGGPATTTLRDLLSHSSGLPSGIRGARLGNPIVSYVANQGRVRDLAGAVEGLRLTHEPGSRVVYSNPGYNVAGLVAAHAVGRPFEQAAQEWVLGPLGMDDSTFAPRDGGPGVATHYGTLVPPRVGPRPATALRLVATPMGGLTSTAVDLARFGRMLLGGGALGADRVLSATTVSDATTLRARNHPDLEQGYGLGLRVRRWEGRTLVGHDGNMPGVATQMLLSPDDGVGVVVLTNGFALAIAHEVAELTLRRVLELSPGDDEAAPATGDDPEPWVALGRRAEGTYRLCDAAPPGPIGRLDAAMTRISVVHEVGGRLRVEGNPGSDGPVWLEPEGRLGHYRVAAAVDDGTDAVLEERADGTHIWFGPLTHLHRPTGRRGRRA